MEIRDEIRILEYRIEILKIQEKYEKGYGKEWQRLQERKRNYETRLRELKRKR